MRAVLDSGKIQLTKSLGQNFLHDANQLQKIASAAKLNDKDKVLEIGPGLGPLTELLLEQAAHVFAIEKDGRLVEFLQEHFGSNPRLELLHADALDYLKEHHRDWGGWKLVANLPYSVASPILVELALAAMPPEMMVATLQLEVAGRLKAAPDTDEYGLLTLLVQLRFKSAGFFKIKRSCFFPEPDVDSACIVLQKREKELLPAELVKSYVGIVKQSFSQRRKKMAKLLTHWRPADWVGLMGQVGIGPNERAEKVSVEQFVNLTKAFADAGRNL